MSCVISLTKSEQAAMMLLLEDHNIDLEANPDLAKVYAKISKCKKPAPVTGSSGVTVIPPSVGTDPSEG